jgi:NADH-quinone oxidoreductase subunit M
MNPLLLLLLIPVATIALILLLPQVCPKRFTVAAFLVNFVITLGLLLEFQGGSGFHWTIKYPWVDWPGVARIHFHLGVDGISLMMTFLTTLVSLAAAWVSPAKVKRSREFFIYVLLISLGALGAFLSRDLFFIYIFHEFALIPTFLLIGIWGGQNRQFASIQMTLYLALGSLILLAGIVGLVMTQPLDSRTFDLEALQQIHVIDEGYQKVIYPLLMIGFGILISIFPFHSWAPTGYASAPSAAAMLHAGVLKKFGLYGLLRLLLPSLESGAKHWEPVLLVLILGNVLYVGYVTMAQKEFSLMLGYSSVMHMGYLFLALASRDSIALSGFVILMVAHGISAALLFALAGEIQSQTGESRIASFGGMYSKAPFFAILLLVGSMASIGLPGFANFAGEVVIFFGSFKAHPWVTTLCVWGVVISAVYQLRAFRSICFGEVSEVTGKMTDAASWAARFPYLILVASSLWIGVNPQSVIKMVRPCVELILNVGGR